MTNPLQLNPALGDPSQLLKNAQQALARGHYRLAELMLRELVEANDKRPAVVVNYGLALLYQFRYWEAAEILFAMLDAYEGKEREARLQRLEQGLRGYAASLRKGNLVGDAADCEALVAVLGSGPVDPVQLAARWIPHLSRANQMRTLAEFGIWMRFSAPRVAIRNEDLDALSRMAMGHENRNVLVPLLVNAFMLPILRSGKEPKAWRGILGTLAAQEPDLVTALSLGLFDLGFAPGEAGYQPPFLIYMARTLMLHDGVDPHLLDAWFGLMERLRPGALSGSRRMGVVNHLFDIYRIDRAHAEWRQVWEEALARDFSRLEWAEVMRYQTQHVFTLPYLSASLSDRKALQDRVSLRFEQLIEEAARGKGLRPLDAQGSPGGGPLRIGYLTHTVGRHSVGFLLEQMVKWHSQGVRVHVYDSSPSPVADDVTRAIVAGVHAYRRTPVTGIQTAYKAAQTIARDGIDVLVDLDGTTLPAHNMVTYFRPAPVSCTYLGGDACGVRWTDRFLVDPHVLPEDAGAYYREGIARLPRFTWVLGEYEVAASDRWAERKALGIWKNDIAYLIAAPGRKIDHDIAYDAMRILAAVPRSVLLIKGRGNAHWMKAFWHGIAAEVGVDIERLHFIGLKPTPALHRAQLRLADVVLDTHPCNGGSHGFENLWVGNPVVTRPGETFFSRMGLSMARNLRIDGETVAWSREDYVARAVRLGTDREHREGVRERLREAVVHKTGIWDAEGLTQDLETTLAALVGRH